MSKTQVDRLGERLKKSDITDDDLRLLDQYRHSFAEAYEIVVARLRSDLNLEPTGRRVKSTASISDKLVRESIRLTQIQDIAGCRLIVPNVIDQNVLLESLKKVFSDTETFGDTIMVDRRTTPSNGYRAMHVVVSCLGRKTEIQLRTALQQFWAELSEKFADKYSPEIKYGGGDQKIQNILLKMSSMIAKVEEVECYVFEKTLQASKAGLTPETQEGVIEISDRVEALRTKTFEDLKRAVENL